MNSVIVLIERDRAITKVHRVFQDWDWATLICAKENVKAKLDTFRGFYLEEVPFDGETSASDFNISHVGEEIVIKDWTDQDNEVIATVYLEYEEEEEYFHEEASPRKIRSIGINDIKICGTSLDDLKLSDELKRMIRSEAETYLDELRKE